MEALGARRAHRLGHAVLPDRCTAPRTPGAYAPHFALQTRPPLRSLLSRTLPTAALAVSRPAIPPPQNKRQSPPPPPTHLLRCYPPPPAPVF